MKQQEHKTDFIRLRAEGRSLRAISAELGVSKSTLSEWDKALTEEISQLRRENLEELYTAYGMAKEARIRRLGETLSRIDTALDAVDLSALPPDKLLLYKLKYQEALREEYTAPAAEATGEADSTLEALRDLYRRTASGEISTEKAKTEAALIDKVVSGYTRTRPLDDLLNMF